MHGNCLPAIWIQVLIEQLCKAEALKTILSGQAFQRSVADDVFLVRFILHVCRSVRHWRQSRQQHSQSDLSWRTCRLLRFT